MLAEKLVPVWENHMAERDAKWYGHRPHWYLSTRYIYRLTCNESYDEYMIEDFQKIRYFTHEDIWRGIAEIAA